MSVLVYIPFLACALTGLTVRPLARRADPRVAARVLAVVGALLAAASSVALALLAFTVVAEVPIVASIGKWSANAVASHVPVPWWIGAVAVGCVVATATNVAAELRRLVRVLPDATRLQLGAEHEIVRVGDEPAYAYACRPVPFRRGVIVVSDGLLARLDASEQSAVLAHERAHLAHQHALYAWLALVIGSLNPALRPLRREIDYSLERWADEQAAAETGRTATALALASTAAGSIPLPGRTVLHHAQSDVPARIRALLAEPRPKSKRLITLAAANAVVACLAVVLAAHHTELIFEALQRH
jgi:beta-lactamase regulating signal transducer with metallopeptidase domain